MNHPGPFTLSLRERAGVRAAPSSRSWIAAAALLLTAAAPPPGAESCTGCHAAGSGMGALAGIPAASIEAAMQGFRDHTRPATLMGRIAPGVTPEQTHAIAAWFEQQR